MPRKQSEFLGVRIPEWMLDKIDRAVKDSNGKQDRSDVVREMFTFYFAMTESGLDSMILKNNNGNGDLKIVKKDVAEILRILKRKR